MMVSRIFVTVRCFVLIRLLGNTKKNSNWQKQPRRCSVKKGLLRNFIKFTGKHLCQILFLKKIGPQACNFIKKETLAQVFSCEFCKVSKNIVFIEHLRATTFQLVTCIWRWYWVVVTISWNSYVLTALSRKNETKYVIHKRKILTVLQMQRCFAT